MGIWIECQQGVMRFLTAVCRLSRPGAGVAGLLHNSKMENVTMAKLNKLNPLAATVGAAFMAGALSTSAVNAAENPFVTTDLGAGYQVAGDHMEGKCGEGKCGGEKGKEGSCGEEKGKEGSCGGEKGKEGSCGGEKGKEGSCGGEKGGEGKCGEGKCGGSA